ncbi:hypothetical protein P7K49_034243 [Saguinus oedipus]|uniref:Uncharacterized protein n=1 Tax=Saguinus oedipus TaxID=9490 RepID=A0ABQ9TU63_SAGOE|nr:hypothetical protein P7K49_034243 [Saguinus oedipus]
MRQRLSRSRTAPRGRQREQTGRVPSVCPGPPPLCPPPRIQARHPPGALGLRAYLNPARLQASSQRSGLPSASRQGN